MKTNVCPRTGYVGNCMGRSTTGGLQLRQIHAEGEPMNGEARLAINLILFIKYSSLVRRFLIVGVDDDDDHCVCVCT